MMIEKITTGPPVQRKPLKRRDFEVDPESRLGKTQGKIMSSVRGSRGGGRGRRGGRGEPLPLRASSRLRPDLSQGVDTIALPTPAPSTLAPLTPAPLTPAQPEALLENPTGPTDQEGAAEHEPEAPPVTRRRRGLTRASVETNRGIDAPKIRVTFSNGFPIGENMNRFKTTVFGWIHMPTVLPQNVRNYGEVPLRYKEAFFKRLIDLFEIVVVEPPTRRTGEAGSSSQTVDPTANPTSSTTTHPTTTPASSVASNPELPSRLNDPTTHLPLSNANRYVVDGWVRDCFRSHRQEICKKHYDAYETDEERLAHPPEFWPEDMWRWVVEYWGSDSFKLRRVGKDAKAKSTLKHTAGSENYKSKRYKLMLETGEPDIDERQFFLKTHAKKDGSFVDDGSRIIGERIEERTRELTLESGIFIGTSGGVMKDIMGAPTKGREHLKGRVPPKPRSKGVSMEEMQRVLDDQRRALEEIHRKSMQEMERRLNERMSGQWDEFMIRFQWMQSQQHPPQLPPPP